MAVEQQNGKILCDMFSHLNGPFQANKDSIDRMIYICKGMEQNTTNVS